VQFRTFQGFEGMVQDDWAYSVNPSQYNSYGSPLVVGQNNVWARIQEFYSVFSAASGNYMYGMADFNQSGWHTLDFAPVAIQGMNNGVLSFKYITFNLSSLDELQYSVMYDNSGSWTNYVNLDRNNQFWQTIQVNVPQGVSHARLRIRSKQVNGIVCVGIDDVELQGSICLPPPEITTGICGGTYCANDNATFTVPFTTAGYFTSGNVFQLELSDAFGNFNNPVVIGSLTLSGSNPSGTITGTLPANIQPGAAYRVRVVSTSPAVVGTDNGTNIIVQGVSASLTAPTFAGGHHISCPGANDGSIDLTPQMGTLPFTYAWSGPNGFSATSEDLLGLAPGTYTVTITDANNCSATEAITLTSPNLTLTVQATGISCTGAGDGAIDANVSGSGAPFTYAWTGPNGFTATTEDLSGLAPGTYTLVTTDANGCTATGNATVFEPAALASSLQAPINGCGHHVSCAGGADASIDLTVNGGTVPYTYLWTGPGGLTFTSEDLSNIGAGTYDVTVTDANGCQITLSQVITAPPALGGSLSALVQGCGYNISCFGGNDGQAEVDSVWGGCPPYTYAWSNGDVSATATGLSAGTHSVTITDAQGCTFSGPITLTEPAELTAFADIGDASCESAADGTIGLSPSGGCAPYTYSWIGPNGFLSNDMSLSGLFYGNYVLTLTDASGCSAVFNFEVEIENLLHAELSCCLDTFVTAGTQVNWPIELEGPGPFELDFRVNDDTFTVNVMASPYLLMLQANETSTVEILGISNTNTGCEGSVCGMATVAVMDSDTNCADLCVNAGVISVNEVADCRTVSMEFGCDTLCTGKLPAKSGGACNSSTTINFNTDPQGNPIPAGTIPTNQWASMGVTVNVINNNPNHPQAGVLFDTGNPTGGDFDLGTPHADFGGPGVGPGGAMGMPGQNDTPLGNVLVIAENDIDSNNDGLIDDPDDEAGGGEIQLLFASPLYVENVTMLDLDNGNGFVRVTQNNGQFSDFTIPGLGDNAVTTIGINMDS
ncbi:MAG: SprB repeat-containing protein, partial [Bacteroidota bacterium]